MRAGLGQDALPCLAANGTRPSSNSATATQDAVRCGSAAVAPSQPKRELSSFPKIGTLHPKIRSFFIEIDRDFSTAV